MSFEYFSPDFRDSLRAMGDKLATKASGKDAFLAYVAAAYDELYETRNDSDKEMMSKASSSNPGVVLVALSMKAMKGEGAKTP